MTMAADAKLCALSVNPFGVWPANRTGRSPDRSRSGTPVEGFRPCRERRDPSVAGPGAPLCGIVSPHEACRTAGRDRLPSVKGESPA
jgi:hypothetical protein